MKLGYNFIAMVLLLGLGACGGDEGTPSPTPTPTSSPTSTPTPAPAQTTAAFIAMASAGSGTMILSQQPDHFTFSGCLVKQKTGDRRVLGAAHFMTNESGVEYRVTKFSYILDNSGLLPGESAESDIGFTILPSTEVVALNSGEETLITHQYDAAPMDRGVSTMTLQQGGIAIPNDSRLSAGSVSGIFPQVGGGAVELPDDRIADGKFMRMCYSAEIVRADLITEPPVASYRSPYRDRSYVADPARTTAPFTNFKNTTDQPLKVYGITTFISNLTDSEPSEHQTDVYVNGALKVSVPLSPHIPGTSAPLDPFIVPVDLTLQPGDVLSVRGKITPKKAIVFDYAAFIFADKGLTHVDEKLNVLDADLNGDGFKDIVDLDATGSLWVSIRVSGGLQDTQGEWARRVGSATTFTALPRTSASAPLYIQATNDNGLCLNMRSFPQDGRFVMDYCQTTLGASNDTDFWGDFNGDGWIDRMRVDPSRLTYLVALGGPNGLAQEVPWIYGYGAVDKIFVSDPNNDGRDDFEAEWYSGQFRCVIWTSTGSTFDMANCPS